MIHMITQQRRCSHILCMRISNQILTPFILCYHVYYMPHSHVSHSHVSTKQGSFKATNWGKLLCLVPQVVAFIISLPWHFSSWNLIIQLKANVIVDYVGNELPLTYKVLGNIYF